MHVVSPFCGDCWEGYFRWYGWGSLRLGHLHRAVVLKRLAMCIDSSGDSSLAQVWTSPMVGNDPGIMPSCSQAS